MAKSCYILLFIALTVTDFMTTKAKLCEKPSKTWYGECKDEVKCDKRCIEWEGAEHGSCHEREAKYMCFCYTQCRPKDKNPTPPTVDLHYNVKKN
ncbi:putative knottin, scorpion toxin, defensin, plant, knottin, scorpion toxin-like superfamily [Helianthus annuus]|nr:putative knottin, scorpion toxin, defensin, plant, knottin, scorpion toxin-like superfamily [Helianthus annuus]